MYTLESFYGAGGRKRARARVFIVPVKAGRGCFTVNKRVVTDYFPELAAVDMLSQPLQVLGLHDLLDQYHIRVTVKGGGKSGQRDAIRLALAKALVMLDEKQMPARPMNGENDDLSFRRQLRRANLYTRDARKVERKLPGLHKARKRAPLVKR